MDSVECVMGGCVHGCKLLIILCCCFMLYVNIILGPLGYRFMKVIYRNDLCAGAVYANVKCTLQFWMQDMFHLGRLVGTLTTLLSIGCYNNTPMYI